MVTSTRPPLKERTPTVWRTVAPPSAPARPEEKVAGKDRTRDAEQLRKDRISAAIAIAIVLGFIALIGWLASISPAGPADPTWDYMYMY